MYKILASCLILSALQLRGDEFVDRFFQARDAQRYHLSIGAVLFNEEGKIACHHFENAYGHRNIYILMRESMENGETPLMTLHRGLMEEFGAVGEPIAFLGCLTGVAKDDRFSFDKTTLYIACRVSDWNLANRDPHDPEAGSQIEWIEPEKLIELMKAQGVRYPGRSDADESEIVRRSLPYLSGEKK